MAAGVRFGAVSKGLIGSHLHSSYFEVLLNSGLLGFIPWVVCLIIVSKKIVQKMLSPPRWFTEDAKIFHVEILTILIFSLIRSIAGTNFVYFDYIFMLYLGLVAYSVVITKKDTIVSGPAKKE